MTNLLILSVMVFCLARNLAVFLARRREIDACGMRASAAIRGGNYETAAYYEPITNGPSHVRMMLHLHKWTHSQFYPTTEAQ